ncbi:MAG TPA: transketolase [Candidatus Diapherotrites archaeon]|uniref:Transketolase n=1 Tax=Candidatus Iainarchaeum sp. TaxID=3101447 RepID=A0A7J4IYA6_9ARCH|nr:transketolase [Candidatus Diapherotrites archaeon]
MATIGKDEVKRLRKIAYDLRKDILEMTTIAGSGHPTTSFSCIDIMAALYFKLMKHDPKNPQWADRDRFIMSKGHGAPALYACLAKAGYFDRGELKHLRQINSMLQGHPDRTKTPGVEISTGSLGMGLSVANGMAYAARLDRKDHHMYVLFGDGELQEGQCWEAIMATPFFGFNNVTVIVDRNNLQNDGWVDQTKDVEPVDKKFEAFGWKVIKINGHRFEEIVPALGKARVSGKPVCIVAKTIKGKGVKFIENTPDMHGKALTNEQYIEALKVLK